MASKPKVVRKKVGHRPDPKGSKARAYLRARKKEQMRKAEKRDSMRKRGKRNR